MADDDELFVTDSLCLLLLGWAACSCWVRGLLRLWRWHVVRRTKKAEAERGQALVQRVYLLYRRNQYVLAPGDETFSKFLGGKNDFLALCAVEFGDLQSLSIDFRI